MRTATSLYGNASMSWLEVCMQLMRRVVRRRTPREVPMRVGRFVGVWIGFILLGLSGCGDNQPMPEIQVTSDSVTQDAVSQISALPHETVGQTELQLPEGWNPLDSLPTHLRASITQEEVTKGCLPRRTNPNEPVGPAHPMPLWYDVTGRWRAAGTDTVELLLEYHVVGDVESPSGAGYPAYRILQRLATDTVHMTATLVETVNPKYSCPTGTRTYFSRREAEQDPGLFFNEREFLRLIRVADSILAIRQRNQIARQDSVR